MNHVDVHSPAFGPLGRILQQSEGCRTAFVGCDASGTVVFKIQGGNICCNFSLFGGNVVYEVLSADGSTKIGAIEKVWSGIGAEYFTDADVYSLSFPMDLHVKAKALLMAAAFLI
ncbi:unnamed protein product, partial [Mesocestoides corti]